MTELLKGKEAAAIGFLQAMQGNRTYHLAFSGGKDSCVIKHLADKAGVKYEAVYRVTSVDPPELVRFIKEYHPDVKREIPHYRDGKPITMWSLCLDKKSLPTRLSRFCCEYLKESAGEPGQMTITGVRWAESTNREKNQGRATVYGKGSGLENDPNFTQTPKGGVVLLNDNDDSRQQLDVCALKHKITINPIIDWTDAEVWEYIREEKIPYCSLYDEGFHRLGCIGCPMARYAARVREFNRWTKYRDQYMRITRKVYELKKAAGRPIRSESAEDYFAWWMEDPNVQGQISMFDEMKEDE